MYVPKLETGDFGRKGYNYTVKFTLMSAINALLGIDR
jgi:hypothetical protein